MTLGACGEKRNRAVRRTVTIGWPVLVGVNVISTCTVTTPSFAAVPGVTPNDAGNVEVLRRSGSRPRLHVGVRRHRAPRDTSARIESTRNRASVSTTTRTEVGAVVHPERCSRGALPTAAPRLQNKNPAKRVDSPAHRTRAPCAAAGRGPRPENLVCAHSHLVCVQHTVIARRTRSGRLKEGPPACRSRKLHHAREVADATSRRVLVRLRMFVRIVAVLAIAVSLAIATDGHADRRRAQLASNCPAAAPRDGETCTGAMVHRTCRYDTSEQHTRCSCVHPDVSERARWICRASPVNGPSPAPPGPPAPPAPAR